MKPIFIFLPSLLLMCCDSKTDQSIITTNTHTPNPITSSETVNTSELSAEKEKALPSNGIKSKHNYKAPSSPFNEELDASERRRLLAEFSVSNDPETLEILAACIDVPFLEKGKQNVSELLTAKDWEVFPCMDILRKKGNLAVPALLHELSDPSPSISEWSKAETNKQLQILRILRSIVGIEQLEQLLSGMEAGPNKESAMKLLTMMKSKASH